MKGKYHIIVQNRRIKFEFDIRRNITIIRGDSATGKTTLMNMLELYERLGDESGITLSCQRPCRTLNNNNWESVIDGNQDSIIFIDEETKVIKTTGFAEKIRKSSNYYVIITREDLPNLPYSVEEVYGIHTSGKYADIRQTYNSFYQLYSVKEPDESVKKTDLIVVEDTNAGFEFYDAVTSKEIECISAAGKSKIKTCVLENAEKHMLIVADGAAFGSEMGELYLYMQQNPNVQMYLPESFEWIILSSGLVDGSRISEIIKNTEEYVDSESYFSWEQFFTKLLIEETKDTYLQYRKNRLNKAYLNPKERAALLRVVKVIAAMIGDDSEVKEI